MSDDLERIAGRARDDLTGAVDAAAGPAPSVAAVARRAGRRRNTHVALAVAAVLSAGSTVVWSQAGGGDGLPSSVVAGQPEGRRPGEGADRQPDPASGNRCLRPTYLPAGVPSRLAPGPAQAGEPIAGPREEVFHWGDGRDAINVAVADTPYPPEGESHYTVLGAEANAGVLHDSGGGRTEWVAFPACGRSWVLSATSATDGRGVPPGELRKVAEGLVPGDPDRIDPTGVTGILFAYAPLAADAVIPVHGPIPGAGPAAGRVVALANGVEVLRADVPDTGRFMLTLPAGGYDIVTFLDGNHHCGQQRVAVEEHRVRSLVFTCRRPGESPATTVTGPRGDDLAQGDPEADPRPCPAAEFPVTARSTQERYTGDEIVRITYEFTNRSASPCIFPHQSEMRIVNEAGEVVWQALTTHDCPDVGCRHIQPGGTRTGGEEWSGTTSGTAPERQRVPDGLYRAEFDFEVEDPRNPQAEPVARYRTTTAPFRISSQ